MDERIARPEKYVDDGKSTPLEFGDPKLYQYALLSDNVLAVSVVVTQLYVQDERLQRSEVKAVEDYKFLNSSYVPVLKQLESAKMQQFYFNNKLENATKDANNMKFRNPKYLSILNHLRFYLPEMYPKLHRILFLDDDIVVQRDLTGLWKIDMDGKVNGGVETCIGLME
nr:galacturonosyltransferase 8-like [Nicotiana tomentosiformis]